MPQWWLVTWTTYGTWLPGDPRGFQTWRGHRYVPPPKRYAKPAERTYQSVEYETEHHLASKSMTQDPVHLMPDQRRIAVEAIVAQFAEMPIDPAILAVGGEHAHFLARFGAAKIRRTVGILKAAASRELHAAGTAFERVWTRGCHMKSKTTVKEVHGAFEYVRRHECEGAVVHVWRRPTEIAHES